jgi:hypothetical protein
LSCLLTFGLVRRAAKHLRLQLTAPQKCWRRSIREAKSPGCFCSIRQLRRRITAAVGGLHAVNTDASLLDASSHMALIFGATSN